MGRLNWEHSLKLAAHGSQIILVIGGVVGYFLTIRPINQKEKLEEDMIVLNEQASIRQAEARFLQAEIERSREIMRGLEADRERLAEEQLNATRQLEAQRLSFDHERTALTAAHLKFRNEKEIERRAIEARHSQLLQSEIERTKSAKQEAVAKDALLDRRKTFDSLRRWITQACLSPKAAIFSDMRGGQVNACIQDSLSDSPEWTSLSSEDQDRLRQWSLEANRTFRNVMTENPGGYAAFGELVIDELFSSSAPCDSAGRSSGEIIELQRPGVIEGTRCIGSTRMKETIGDLVSRYSALQLAIEAAISGAADSRDPSRSFIRPNAPTLLTVE